MDDVANSGVGKTSATEADCDRSDKLRERLDKLLLEAAELEVELSRADGSIIGVPHYSVIEGRAHELGKRLSRKVQQRQMNEVAASQPEIANCPTCGMRCRGEPKKREIKAVDGPLELLDVVAECVRCRRSFFPVA